MLPAAVPDLSYDQLDGVKDGMMAVSAYQEERMSLQCLSANRPFGTIVEFLTTNKEKLGHQCLSANGGDVGT